MVKGTNPPRLLLPNSIIRARDRNAQLTSMSRPSSSCARMETATLRSVRTVTPKAPMTQRSTVRCVTSASSIWLGVMTATTTTWLSHRVQAKEAQMPKVSRRLRSDGTTRLVRSPDGKSSTRWLGWRTQLCKVRNRSTKISSTRPKSRCSLPSQPTW